MKTIDVCLSPDLMHLYDVHDCTVVVVDVLRATSCMVTAFAHGVDHIVPLADLELCRAMKQKGYVTSGERDGEKVDGFDLGNSPFEYMNGSIAGGKIAFTTTNGTRAIEKSKGAREIFIGSFLNVSAVAESALKSENKILVVCAAWKGKVNLEDTLFAGALVEKLKDHIEPDCDAPLAAQHLYNQAKSDLAGFLENSSHVKRLKRLNIQKDIEFCLKPDRYNVVPRMNDARLII